MELTIQGTTYPVPEGTDTITFKKEKKEIEMDDFQLVDNEKLPIVYVGEVDGQYLGWTPREIAEENNYPVHTVTVNVFVPVFA